MASKKDAPPVFTSERPYADWVRMVTWWQSRSDLSPEKQGLALAGSLDGKALDAIFELTDAEINHADGVKNIIAQLDKLFKKETLTEKIEDIESFENFVRSDDMSIKDYINEFDKRLKKLSSHKIVYPDDIKGYRLLKNSKIQTDEEKLIKATITSIAYDTVLKKLKDVFGDAKPGESRLSMKTEPIFHTKQEAPSDEEGLDDEFQANETSDAFYTRRPYNQNNSSNNNSRYNNNFGRSGQRQNSSSSTNWRTDSNNRQARGGRNPRTRTGIQTKCRHCESIYHWEKDCPDKLNDVNLTVNELVLHANNETVLKSLVAETWNSIVLDCGCTSTVCGKKWFSEYQSSLNDDERAKIKFSTSKKSYRFGDGEVYRATEHALIPAYFGDVRVMVSTDIVDADIPLLFSKEAMKKGGMHLEFDQDVLFAFEQSLPLNTTMNNLYALPITKTQSFIEQFKDEESNTPVVLTAVRTKTDEDIAKNLHRVFAHPSTDRLLRLVNSAGAQWSNNTNLKNEIQKVASSCDVCKVYKKPPARPVDGLPMATSFQQVVAMDLKEYKGKQILHLVDLCTRLSAATFIPNKKKETIV